LARRMARAGCIQRERAAAQHHTEHTASARSYRRIDHRKLTGGPMELALVVAIIRRDKLNAAESKLQEIGVRGIT
jgi:hypothetical protein